MIPEHLIQKAVINKIKYSTGVPVSISLTENTKEDQYQNSDFTYPAIRVNIEDQVPLGNGVGRTKLSSILFSVIVASEKASSLETNQLSFWIIDILFDKQIKGTDEQNNSNYFILNRIDLITGGKALRVDDRTWEREMFFQSELYKL